MPTIAEALGSFIHGLSFDRLPEAVVKEAKYRLLDFIASALPARNEPPVKVMLDWVAAQKSNPESSIILYGRKVAARYAALVNGVMGHSLELDDTLPSVAHAGVVVMPPSLALAEREGVDGRALIEAIVAGYEVACRVGSAATPIGILHEKGFHPTGVNGVFGATASACKILGLDAEETATAIGIAGSMSSGLLECTRDGTWTKRFHPGWASHNGILAAELAKMGYTAPRTIFEGRLGYFNAFVGKTSSPSKILEGLGESFQIFRPGYKIYACCKGCHAPINAVLRILERQRIDPRDIERIEVRMQRIPYLLVAEPKERKYSPRTTVDAQFSIYYSIAVTIIDGKPPLHDAFSANRIGDEEVLKLAKRVRAVIDPELEKRYGEKTTMDAIVTIVMKDGRRFTEVNSEDFDHPPPAQLEDKFRRCAAAALSESEIGEVLEKVKHLERVGDVGQIMDILRKNE